MSRINKHVERSERTRAELISAGRELFSDRGYAKVSIEDVVRRAGVTRGALYHQFPGGKEDLFAAVFDDVEEGVMAGIADTLAEAGAEDPIAGVRAGIDATLALALDPKLVRLTILDAPGVLGWEAWRAAGERYGLGLVRAGLTAAMDAGEIPRAPVDPLAQLVLAAVEEAIVYVARADDPKLALEEARDALNRLVDGLASG
ncbi:MAG TPA: TetR/AcrR family transcriptional regulator [Thermoleophilaceae bacterium]|nr:TetR/AcrR family transcriptional regulator [Thermoleophilaceae bacterium]